MVLQYCRIKKDIPKLCAFSHNNHDDDDDDDDTITELLLFKPSIKCFKCIILFNSYYIEILFSAFSWGNQGLKDRLAQYQSWYNILLLFFFLFFLFKEAPQPSVKLKAELELRTLRSRPELSLSQIFKQKSYPDTASWHNYLAPFRYINSKIKKIRDFSSSTLNCLIKMAIDSRHISSW